MEVRPRLGLIDVPEIVSTAAQDDGQVGMIRLRHGDRQLTGKQQPVRGCGAEVRADPLLLCRVPRYDGAEELAALGQKRQPRVTDAGLERGEVALRGDLGSGRRQVLTQFGLRQTADCAFEIRYRPAVAMYQRSGATREKFPADPLRTRPGSQVVRGAHRAQIGGNDQLGNEVLRDFREHVGPGSFLGLMTENVRDSALEPVRHLDLHEIFAGTVKVEDAATVGALSDAQLREKIHRRLFDAQ